MEFAGGDFGEMQGQSEEDETAFDCILDNAGDSENFPEQDAAKQDNTLEGLFNASGFR